jgi:hypothetical protein
VLAELNSGMAKEKIELFIDSFTASPDELTAVWADSASEWDFIALQRQPILLLSNGYLVPDEQYLLDAVTAGLYYRVLDHVNLSYGRPAGDAWSRAYSRMVEEMVEDQFRAMAPASMEQPAYFDEDQLEDAYPKGGKRCDFVIDYGTAWLLGDVVKRDLRRGAAVDGSFEVFAEDIARTIEKKASQLDDSGRRLSDDPVALTGSPSVENKVMVPVIVVGGSFPLEPTTVAYVHDRLVAEGLLQFEGVKPVAILDFEDVDFLEALAEAGESIVDVLQDWAAGPLMGIPFTTYVQDRYHRRPRSARATAESDSVWEQALKRLQLTQ